MPILKGSGNTVEGLMRDIFVVTRSNWFKLCLQARVSELNPAVRYAKKWGLSWLMSTMSVFDDEKWSHAQKHMNSVDIRRLKYAGGQGPSSSIPKSSNQSYYRFTSQKASSLPGVIGSPFGLELSSPINQQQPSTVPHPVQKFLCFSPSLPSVLSERCFKF